MRMAYLQLYCFINMLSDADLVLIPFTMKKSKYFDFFIVID
jgi:hypothetical protein